MNLRIKKLLITLFVCSIFTMSVYAATDWGVFNTTGYRVAVTEYKYSFNEYATVNISQGPVEDKCAVFVYLQRADGSSYKSEVGVYRTCTTKNLNYDDDNYYYGNYYHNSFNAMVKIAPNMVYSTNVVNGTVTP